MKILRSFARGILNAKKPWMNSTVNIRKQSLMQCNFYHMWIVKVLQSLVRLGYIFCEKSLIPIYANCGIAQPARLFRAYFLSQSSYLDREIQLPLFLVTIFDNQSIWYICGLCWKHNQISVVGNVKTFDAIRNEIKVIDEHLLSIKSVDELELEKLESLRMILEILDGFYKNCDL